MEGKNMIWTSLYKCISWRMKPTVSGVLDTISKILLFLNPFKIKIIRYYFKKTLDKFAFPNYIKHIKFLF